MVDGFEGGMMASVEIIGLLCAGSVRYHPARGRSAGEALSRAELAGLLSGLTGPQMHLAMARYAGDESSERKLIAHVRVWAAGIAIREDWKIVRGRPLVCNMAALAVLEVVRPNRCRRCQGRGSLISRICCSCGGSGYYRLSGRRIADAIGVDHANYIRSWCGRYERAVRYVQGIDSQVIIGLRMASKEVAPMVCYAI
jgi:hypothetical protein